MKAAAAMMLSSFALLSTPAASAGDDLLPVLNAVRARGCSGHPGVDTALHRDTRLDRVAAAVATGGNLRPALIDAGYPAAQSAMLEISGGDNTIGRVLAGKGCNDITHPGYRDVGIARRVDNTWIILAAPRVAPAASDTQAVSREVLALVNEARSQRRRCGRKRFDATTLLRLSESLQRASLAHAREMAERRALSHTGRDGSTPGERVARTGYEWRAVGENIASGQMTAEQAVAGWLESPRHCANVMSPDFSEMGVAYATDPNGEARTYWAQLFASPRTGS